MTVSIITLPDGRFVFDKPSVTIHIGDSVKWVNNTLAPHTTTSDPGDPASWDADLLNEHDSFTMKFTIAGTYGYSCMIHPNMPGKVIVTA